MICVLFGTSGEVVQIGEDEMRQIMKDVIHGPLEGGTNIFNTKGNELVCECAPWCCEGCFVLICIADLNLIIPKEPIQH